MAHFVAYVKDFLGYEAPGSACSEDCDCDQTYRRNDLEGRSTKADRRRGDAVTRKERTSSSMDLAVGSHTNDHIPRDYRSLKVRYIGTLERLRNAERTSKELAEANTELGRRIDALEESKRRREDENTNLQERLRIVEEQHRRTSNLLEVRSAALKGVETFLDTADKYSGADIIAMVEKSNIEILQAAARIAEFLDDTATIATPEQQKVLFSRYNRALEDVRRHIGDDMFEYLKKNGGDMEANGRIETLQLALQALFTGWFVATTNNISGSGFQAELARLYDRIRVSEPQGVTGRWRAITHMHMKLLKRNTSSGRILDAAIGLLCVCGWNVDSPSSQKVVPSMREMIGTLESQSVQLQSTLKEGITTCDMEVFAIALGQEYTANDMEDVDSAASRLPTKIFGAMETKYRVLCTVGMGLRKTVMKRKGGVPVMQVDVLLKPTVALSKVLGEWDVDKGGLLERPQ